MATNTINVKANGYQSTSAYQFRITATLTGNVENNTREVQIVFDTYAQNPGGYKSYSSPKAYIRVTEEGSSEETKATATVKNIWPRDQWVEMAKWTGYLSGGQTIIVKGRYNSNSTTSYLPLNGNHDVSVELQIPNVSSQITSSSSLSYTIGNDISLGVAKYITTATDTLTIKYGNTTLFSDNNYVNGKQISPIASALQSIYTSTKTLTQIDLVATLKTYVDGVQIGSDSVLNFKGDLPKDVQITSATAIDTNSRTISFTGDPSIIIKGASILRVTINATFQYGGELSRYGLNGQYYNAQPIEIPSLYNNNSLLRIEAISKRNYVSSYIIDLEEDEHWVNYQKPTINITNLKRNTPVDGNVNVSLSGTWFNGSFGAATNQMSLYYRYKKSTDQTWSNWTQLSSPTISGNTYSLSTQLSGFSYEYIWNFDFAITDLYYSYYEIITSGTIQKGVTIWDVGEHDVAFRVPVNVKNGLNVLGTITGPTASSSALGFMSANDKAYLDNLISSNLIIESNISDGNISDGYYIKFANGLMITIQKYTIQNSTSWTAWGGIYSAQINAIKDFPEEFSQIPMVTVTLESAQDRGGFLSTVAQAPATTTSPGGYQLTRGSTTTGTWQYKLNVFAIGFWRNNQST